MKSELQKLKDGELYDYTDPEVRAAHIRAVELCDEYNETGRTETEKRERICANCSARWAKTHSSKRTSASITGSTCTRATTSFVITTACFWTARPSRSVTTSFIAPQCGFYAVNHPLEADLRNSGVETGVPITVGDDVWIGGGVKVMPGVTIGSNVVIGGGSVVVKDIPSNSLAVGNPARVVKSIPPRK